MDRNGLIVSATAGLAIGGKKFKGTGMFDKSSSIPMRGLVKPLCGAADQIIAGIAAHPGSLLRVSLFDAEYSILTGDRNPDGDIWGQFVPAEQVAQCPLEELYESGHGTYLERYLSRELQVLRHSYDDDTSEVFVHVLFLVTDGVDTAPEKYKRGRDIRRYMDEVKDRAYRCGGIAKSRVVAFYVGVGLTEERHRAKATEYGFPPEWVLCVKDTPDAVQDMGRDVSHTVMDMGRGGHTVINRPDRPKSDSRGMACT